MGPDTETWKKIHKETLNQPNTRSEHIHHTVTSIENTQSYLCLLKEDSNSYNY